MKDRLEEAEVHSPGQGERSEPTPWVTDIPNGTPCKGKSPIHSHHTFTFALTGRVYKILFKKNYDANTLILFVTRF